jgi:hypothetical protein
MEERMDENGKDIINKFREATINLANLYEEYANSDYTLRLWNMYDEIEVYLKQHYKGDTND